jgi:hypothetical protein
MLPKRNKKLTRLSLFFGKSRLKNINNKFYSKAQCYKANFSNVEFRNVNFKGAILTSCIFKNAKFYQVEFLGSNLKKCNFTGSTFKQCIFVGALLRKANFKGCNFEQCIFINTNIKNCKNMNISNENQMLGVYPRIDIPDDIKSMIDNIRYHKFIQNSRILHLKGGKINNLTMKLILERLGEEKIRRALKNLGGELPRRVITSNGLCNIIDAASRT